MYVFRIVPKSYIVRLAEYDLKDNDNGVEFEVEDIIVHSGYRPPVDYNDIAVLKVKRKISYTSKVQPICLPLGPERTQNLENKRVVVIGWGTIEFGKCYFLYIKPNYISSLASKMENVTDTLMLVHDD